MVMIGIYTCSPHLVTVHLHQQWSSVMLFVAEGALYYVEEAFAGAEGALYYVEEAFTGAGE